MYEACRSSAIGSSVVDLSSNVRTNYSAASWMFFTRYFGKQQLGASGYLFKTTPE
jgi:hypothetical protein